MGNHATGYWSVFFNKLQMQDYSFVGDSTSVEFLPCQVPAWGSVDVRFFNGTGGPERDLGGKAPYAFI